MSGDMLEELPNAGRHDVRTQHALYVFDMDARTITVSGTAYPFESVQCKTRQPMTLKWSRHGRHHTRVTTPVVSIRPAL